MTLRLLTIPVLLTFLALLSLFPPGGVAVAHEELLFVRIRTEPPVPRPDEAFEVLVRLTNSADRAVEGVELRARFLEDASGGEGADASRVVTETAMGTSTEEGILRGTVEPVAAGRYLLEIVEMVGDAEESSATGVISVGGGEPVELQLLLPPTQTGLGGWLVWIVGIPLLAGVLVTLLVLTGRRPAQS